MLFFLNLSFNNGWCGQVAVDGKFLMMKCRFFLFCFFSGLFSFVPSSLASVSSDSTCTGIVDKSIALAEQLLNLMAYETPRYTLAAYPMLGYSDRTGFEIGVTPVLRFNSRKKNDNGFHRPSTIAPSFLFSTKGMYEVEMDIMLFTKHNWCVNSKAQFLYLPDTFYGLGNGDKLSDNASFDSYKYTVGGEVLRGVSDRFFVGIQYDVNYHQFENIHNPENNPMAQFDGSVVGSGGGWSNGLGPVVRFDSRNNVVYPSSGWYLAASHLTYGGFSGSNYRFGNTMLDVRHFIDIKKSEQVLAFQGYFNSVYGDVPFYKLSTAAGKRLLRGIGHPYKYLGRHAWLAQAEYRRYLWWRLGAVVFAGAGNVFDHFDSSAFEQVHLMAGGGLRFRALPKEALNIRLDLGFTSRGDHAIFFTIREAF